MTATITDALRPYKGAIMALVTATKPDGSKWTYKEILRDLGMPVNNAYERAVSKMVNKEGHRRRADFKRSKPDEDGGLLPAEELSTGAEAPTLQSVLDMNQAMWAMKSALDELCAAFDTLCEKYNAMTGQEETND